MRTVIIGAMASVVAACASIGRPEGGPRDETPPEFVRSTPAPGSTGVDRNRIDIFFNENVKLEDIQNKLVVSPAQMQQPVARANGRRVTLELRDSLRDSTTYTIDFSDAVRDLNEGNILDGFAMDFSTGSTIDTLRISGMVFQAENLEPAQGIAIDDRNRDWHWDRSEAVAFSSVTLSPGVEPVEVADTLQGSEHQDSIVFRTAYHYMPDDVLITWFNEKFRPQYLRDYERTDRRRVTLKFGSPSDTLPEITVLNGSAANRRLSDISVLEAREGLDSLVYWISDTAVVAQDSLLVAARYQKTDTLDRLVWTSDTLKLFVRGTTRQQEKDAAKAWEEQLKKREKDQKEFPDSVFPPLVPKVEKVEFKLKSGGSQHLHKPAQFEVNIPIGAIDSTMWRLEMAVDTLWNPVEATLAVDSANIRLYNLSAKWAEGAKYRFVADSAAISDIYGHVNPPVKSEFTAKLGEDYGNVFFDITDIAQIPDSAQLVVELLDNSDKPVASTVVRDGRATFNFVDPATYYARAYIDLNRNGEWDTGELASHRQPEDVFYFSKKIQLRKNWDIDQDWALFELPVDAQKPDDVKRNKPKTKGRNSESDDYDEDEYYDESGFGNTGFDVENSWGNGAQYNNARRNSNRRARPGMRGAGSDQLAR